MAQRTIAGRYELTERLSSGWRATDTELGREVVVRLGTRSDVGATALAHPHIARIFDQGEAEGERYVVLEYLPGGSLAERGALTEDAARDLTAALAYAHAQGVVHGSIGPDAVLFDSEGRAKLADFGGTGEPEDDVRALGALLDSYEQAAPPVPEPTTLIVPPLRRAEPRRRPWAVIALVAAALLAAGVGAAFLATSGGSTEEPTTGSLSVPIPTGSTASTAEETEAPPATTTAETTTEQTTTATTEPEPEPAPAPPPPPQTTIAPPPTTEPPVPTTEPPPPPTTEPPPTTTEPPPATTAPA